MFLKHNFCVKPDPNPEKPEGIQVIVGSINMGYDIRHGFATCFNTSDSDGCSIIEDKFLNKGDYLPSA